MKLKQVEKTINYAKFFNSHLTLDDLYLWLISPQTHTQVEIRQLLKKHPQLQKRIVSKPNPKRIKLTNKKLKSVSRFITIIKHIPTIKLIALTGSLSANNPKKKRRHRSNGHHLSPHPLAHQTNRYPYNLSSIKQKKAKWWPRFHRLRLHKPMVRPIKPSHSKNQTKPLHRPRNLTNKTFV